MHERPQLFVLMGSKRVRKSRSDINRADELRGPHGGWVSKAHRLAANRAAPAAPLTWKTLSFANSSGLNPISSLRSWRA
jgi:hypothetical protein